MWKELVLRDGKVSFFPKLIGSSVGIICSFHSVLLNHVPKVRLVNMNALLQNFRIFTSVVFMSAKLVTTTKHRLFVNESFYILQMSKFTDVVLVYLLLTLNGFRRMFPYFYYMRSLFSENISFELNEWFLAVKKKTCFKWFKIRSHYWLNISISNTFLGPAEWLFSEEYYKLTHAARKEYGLYFYTVTYVRILGWCNL